MTLSERTRKALLEDANIIALAAAAALSIALLNPLPALIMFVGEAAYLVYVPDSAWYGAHLLRRYDSDATRKRLRLRREQPLGQNDLYLQKIAPLEVLRANLSRRKAMGDGQWIAFLRRVDALLESLIIVFGTAGMMASRLGSGGDTGAAIEQRIREHSKNLGYYETTTHVLEQIVRDLSDTGAQAEFSSNLAQVRQQQNDTQRDLFRVVCAEFLLDSAQTLLAETEQLLTEVGQDAGDAAPARWDAEAVRLTEAAQTLSRRLDGWLAGRGVARAPVYETL